MCSVGSAGGVWVVVLAICAGKCVTDAWVIWRRCADGMWMVYVDSVVSMWVVCIYVDC